MSKFSLILEELIFDNKFNLKNFAKAVKISESSLTDYTKHDGLPTVKNLIKIADFFNCSTDFLLGREEENKYLTFKKCPPFSEQLKFLISYSGHKPSYFYTDTDIPKSRFYDWLGNKRQPSVDNVVKIAKLLDRRVDFVLGRES